ncbi:MULTISPECIES: LPP20 family lipoprotein [Sulfurimonas]|uniref:LPP20 family lipoprotein n=1 Tax=Sulfurimonas TaxID=202746 RepID=UPI00126588FA|nr:LPP20 family lipoprotein [Sulfurimonas indica]
MKYSLVLAALLSVASFAADKKEDATVTQVAPAPSNVTPSNVTVVCPTGSCSKPAEVQKVEVINPVEISKPIEIAKPKVEEKPVPKKEDVLDVQHDLLISVVGQGVAPVNTSSPAQAYALAKRAAVADAYRLIAEKVKGVRIDGQDLIKNMMVKRSTVRTSVQAMVRNANIVETTFKEGLCEVEMEITLSRAQFPQ